jgi:alkylated DNA repair dioxygenase AlkB
LAPSGRDARRLIPSSDQTDDRREQVFAILDPVPSLQPSLFATGPPTVRGAAFERLDLGQGAWVDIARDWLGGGDELCSSLIEDVDWHHRKRRMYDRVVEEPRLTHWYGADDPLPHPALGQFRAAMADRYRATHATTVRFGALGLNYYRHGADSVAWHADRELRHLDDTLVAILTLGAARPFLLRPAGGGRSVDIHPASGDVLVMGGTAQLRFEHAVPKTASGPGPRISASIRWVRPPAAD